MTNTAPISFARGSPSLDIPASEQRLHHPGCDVARAQMQLAFAGTIAPK